MMRRGLTGRLAALWLITLLQAGVFSHMEHVLCVPGEDVAPRTGEAGTALPSGGHHQHHGGMSAGPTAYEEGGDQPTPPQPEGTCDFCCAVGQPGLALAGAASLLLGDVAYSGRLRTPDQPLVGRSAHLIPFPNPPPTA